MRQKEFRRIVGFVAARLDQLDFAAIDDPRHARGKRWRLRTILGACLLGMMSGCTSLGQIEQLTARLSRPIRRRFGIRRRLPDTTLYDLLCRLEPERLLTLLWQLGRNARRSKSLQQLELPFHMVAMDGKATWLPSWQGPYAQKHQPEQGLAYGLMRTVTMSLATAAGKPCLGLSPIPAATNEMGQFEQALRAWREHYGRLARLVSYDQGANSEPNAQVVLDLEMDYLFRLNDERRHMQQLAMELLALKAPVAESVDVLSKDTEEVRRLRLVRVNRGLLPKGHRSELWPHTKTLLCVEYDKRRDGQPVATQARYYATSLEAEALTPAQWLWALRAHWGVETTHQVLDAVLQEDEHPWIRKNPRGMLVVLILRRIAYTLLTLYRSVHQRDDDKRQMPWRVLLSLVRDALIASTRATLESLRRRKVLPLAA